MKGPGVRHGAAREGPDVVPGAPAAPGPDARLAILTCFGIGRSPWAPGTFGSLPPVVMALLMASCGAPGWMVVAAVALLGAAGAAACLRFGRHGEARLGREDPGAIVVDEVAGQCVALLAVPWRVVPSDGEGTALGWNAAMAALAFIAFRCFDVLKPPPIAQVQRLGGGVGILVDDLVAGLFAAIVTAAVAWLATRAGW